MIIKKNTIESKYIRLYDYQNKKFGIPIFQRFYSWKEKEVVQLKEDLINAIENKDKQLYLLDFIYYNEDSRYKLADGQQRIVTLNNLIKAIKDVAAEKNIKIDKIELFDIKYDVFVNDNKYNTHFNNYATAPFKKVYLDFCEFIKINIEKINDFIYVIKNNIYVYMKKTNCADEAFKIFQQINTGGKPLTKDEVIKTALDQYSNAYQINFDTSKIKNVRQSIISYYKFKSNNFDKNFDNMEIITFLKKYVTKDKKTFQEFVNTVLLIKDVNDSPIKYVIVYINRNTLIDVLNVLAMKGINVKNDQKYLKDVIIPLCMMSICLTMNGGSPTTFRYLLNDIVKDIKNNATSKTIKAKLIEEINNNSIVWTIGLEDFSIKLGDIFISRNLKKALLIIDVIIRNISGTIRVDSINLEHIYPQNPDSEWAENGWPTHREQQKELIDNIGNYLLLCEEVNKKIQNRYIKHKVAQYNDVIARDIILQTPINTVDFDEFEKKGKSYIDSRKNEIAEIIRDTFPLGKVLIKKIG